MDKKFDRINRIKSRTYFLKYEVNTICIDDGPFEPHERRKLKIQLLYVVKNDSRSYGDKKGQHNYVAEQLIKYR